LSGLRTSPATLRAIVAADAVASPLPAHHRQAIAARSYGRDLLTDGERWFLDSVLRLSSLSERQHARLHEIAARVELGR
jgi:hypothetical protein